MAKKDTTDAALTREDVQAMIDAALLKHDIVHGHHEPVEDEPAHDATDETDNKAHD